MPYCTNCGIIVRKGHNFCYNCGAVIQKKFGTKGSGKTCYYCDTLIGINDDIVFCSRHGCIACYHNDCWEEIEECVAIGCSEIAGKGTKTVEIDSKLNQLLKELDEKGISLRVEEGKLLYSAPKGQMNEKIMLTLKEHKSDLINVLHERSLDKKRQHEYAGNTCPYCQNEIENREPIVVCPELQCQTSHHQNCWEENEGCAAYGCDNRKHLNEQFVAGVENTNTPTDNENGQVNKKKHTNISYEIPKVRPWARWAARILDVYFFGVFLTFLAFIIAALIGNERNIIELERILAGGNQFSYTILIFLIWVFIEPLLLSTWGTTPGKWLFSTYIRDIRGDKLSYTLALNRSIMVWVYGLAFGIPLINLYTLYNSYNWLNKYSKTKWDMELGIFVQHKKIGLWKGILTALFIFLYIAI